MISQLTVYRVDLPHFPTRRRSLNPQHHPSLSAAALLVCRSLVRLRPCVEAALRHLSKFYANIMISGLTLVSRARPFSPVLVGVAGSAAGKKGLVSLGHSLLQRGMQ